MDSDERLSRFRKMLRSMKEQHLQVPLFISISMDPPFENSIQDIVEKYSMFTFFIQNDKRSQFEHYSFLAETISSYDIENTWCIFTDDDDFSHPSRTSVFNDHLHNVDQCNIDVVYDTCVLTQFEDLNGTITSVRSSKSLEYVTIACKLRVLRDFLSKAKGNLCKAGCDMVFSAYTSCKTSYQSFHSDQWLYEYTVRPGCNRSKAYGDKICWAGLL